jgi:two-component system phosphate regulon sensor histidine kinase PhoR
MTHLHTQPDAFANHMQLMERLCHDANSILASIMGYANLVADPGLRNPDADLEPYGQVIVRQTLRLQSLVENALMVTRISENQLGIELCSIHVGPLLKAVVAEARTQSGREISYIDRDRSEVVLADPLCLSEAFAKIIDNALKFSSPDSLVEISLAPDETNDRVIVCVEDHGIGIAQTDLARLYSRFGRICNGQTRAIPGNGLGLYVAGKIIEAHHGEIWVKSEPGQGSIFVISLPNHTDQEEPKTGVE